jgi:hypothetical protein
MIPSARCTLFSLYRTHLRQIKQLPLPYLRFVCTYCFNLLNLNLLHRLFFKIKAADDFRAIVGTAKEDLRSRKIRRVSRVRCSVVVSSRLPNQPAVLGLAQDRSSNFWVYKGVCLCARSRLWPEGKVKAGNNGGPFVNFTISIGGTFKFFLSSHCFPIRKPPLHPQLFSLSRNHALQYIRLN